MSWLLSRGALGCALVLVLVVAVGCGSDDTGGAAGGGGDGGAGGTDPTSVDCERADLIELVPYEESNYFVFDFTVPVQFMIVDARNPLLGVVYELDLADGQAPPQMEIQLKQAPGFEIDPEPIIQDAYLSGAEDLVVIEYDGFDVPFVGQESGTVLGGFMYLPFQGEHIRVDLQFVDTSGKCSEERDEVMTGFLDSMVPNESTTWPDED